MSAEIENGNLIDLLRNANGEGIEEISLYKRPCAHMRSKPVVQRPVAANRYPRRPSQLDITGSQTRRRAIKKRKNKRGWRETGRRQTERERKRERDERRPTCYLHTHYGNTKRIRSRMSCLKMDWCIEIRNKIYPI